MKVNVQLSFLILYNFYNIYFGVDLLNYSLFYRNLYELNYETFIIDFYYLLLYDYQYIYTTTLLDYSLNLLMLFCLAFLSLLI